MNVHLVQSIKGIIKFIFILSIIALIGYVLYYFDIISTPDLIAGIFIFFLVGIIGFTVLWLGFKFSSEIYKSILSRSNSVEEFFLKENIIHLILRGVRSGGEDSSYEEYFYYHINVNTGKVKIQNSSRDDIKISKQIMDDSQKSKRKKIKDSYQYTLQTDFLTFKIFPFSVFFGFDEGHKIEAWKGDQLIWRKKL